MNKKIDLAIYVHEFVEEVGHSRAMIESMRLFPKNQIRCIHIICYKCTDPKILFPNFTCDFKIYNCPSLFSKPFLSKMLFFYIFSFLKTLKLPMNTKKIGIGIASLNAKFINIQFIHKEWDELYFKYISMSLFKKIYKKVLFASFNLFERYLYKQENVFFSVLSKFETDYLRDNFDIDTKRLITNYSGINFNRFYLKDEDKGKTLNRLLAQENELKKFDLNKTTFLFIGALERKGVQHAITEFQKTQESQLIIIGKPEGSSQVTIPSQDNILYIPYTSNVLDFYQISDIFIFPTIYEPFGLVILEAAVMGLDIHTSRQRVGASELIEDISGIHLYNCAEQISLKNYYPKKSFEQKKSQRLQVIKRMSEYTWERNSKIFWNLLNEKH